MKEASFMALSTSNNKGSFLMDSSFYGASYYLGLLYSVAHSNIGQGTMDYCVQLTTLLQEARGGNISITDGVGAVPG